MPQEQPAPEAPSIEGLLNFHLPTYNFTLLDYSLRRTSLSLTAQLHGMFFKAESPRQAPADISMPLMELTCYRRNLFQITGSITLPRSLRYILTDQGDRIPILAQELSISGAESVEGNPGRSNPAIEAECDLTSIVKIITVPWKTPSSTASVAPEEKTEKEPTSIPLDTMSNQDMDADYATFPIAWKRLQFRIATANNGRRKELQQHFIVRLKVIATLSTGTKLPICEAKSAAIIVRGRSPRNFQQRKDYPVSNSTSSTNKGMQPPVHQTRSAQLDTIPQQPALKSESISDSAVTPFNFDNHDMQTPMSFNDWKPHKDSGSSSVSTLATPVFTNPTVLPAYAHTRLSSATSTAEPNRIKETLTVAPEILSLTDDGESSSRSHKSSRTNNGKPKPRPSAYRNPSFSSTADYISTQTQLNLPDCLDTADLLYEYFPLGLDDWMPPVDAVYRPHVVHHTNFPPTSALEQGRGKKGLLGRTGSCKRYFTEEES